MANFHSLAQQDSTKVFKKTPIYSLTDKNASGTPTVRLRPTTFLVYQSLTSSSNVSIQKDFTDVLTRNRDQVTQSNIIPIGILNAEISLPEDKEKKKDFILMASPLEKDIFQAEVQFQINPNLSQSNIDNPISNIEISFDGGLNWKSYKYEAQLINYRFDKIGEQTIGFKLNSKQGSYITFTTVDVKQLQRPSYVETKRVSANNIKGGRVAAGVSGGEYRILMGCDGILDKPIIIAEGFDANESVNLDDLTAKYNTTLAGYRNNGYDLVLVNYNNGRTWIQDNAQVLKAVINQINATKVGNNKLVVIGESMSGLVARWALREMEIAGQTHNVSHFVAFDSPMRGANVPPGFVALRRWLPGSSFPVSTWAFVLNAIFNFVPAASGLDEPAAKQMLLTQQGTVPNPEYFQFQTLLNNLGYPSQNGIKNVALINGALNGTPQRRFRINRINGRDVETEDGELDQGFKMMYFAPAYGIVNYFINVWTHNLNSVTKVFEGTQVGIFTLPSYSNQSINLPLNYDRHPGGRISFNQGDFYTSFCFVPTFSSIDYRGNLNNDNDYFFNIRSIINANFQVTNNALTPFNAIYGNNVNNDHALPSNESVAFDDFGRIELGITNTNGCQGCTAGSGGLTGTYFDNQDLTNNANTRTRIDEVNFSSDEGRYTPFHGSVEIPPYGTFTRTNISARWEGSFRAPIAGTYNFNVRTDDGVRVWFDGIQKINDWGDYPPKDHKFYENLNAGDRKNIRIEWKQGGGGYMAKLLWEFNGIENFIPACHLFQTTTDCNFTVSAAASPTTVSCGGTSTLTATCTGSGCSGVSYDWRESGSIFNTASGSPVSINLRNANGTYSYLLTASKAGCGDKTSSSNPAINVTLCSGQTGMSITNSTGLNNVSNSTNQGSFKINSNNVNWVISSVPTWASVSRTTGGNGTTDITVSFQANNGAYRSATLGVIDVTDITPDQTITISQQGTGGGGGSCNYTEGQYMTTWFGDEVISAYICGTKFYAKNNSGDFKSKSWLTGTGRFTTAELNCFEENDPRSGGCGGGGGCTSPTPTLTASSLTVPSTLSASGCSGTVNWSNGASGNSISVSTAGTYTANCTSPPCSVSGSGSVSVSGSGSSCNYTNGQFMTEWFGNEVIRAYICGTKFFAKNDAGYFKSKAWLTGTGRFTQAELDCFEEVDPGCGASRIAALQSEETDDKIAVYPNPTTGKVKIVFSLPKAENVWLNLYDTQGKSLDLRDFEGKSGRNEMEYDLQNYPSGVYFVNFQSDEKREVLKVVKVN